VNEVSSRPLKGLLAAARKLNFDVPALVAGLPFDEQSVEQNIRVDWDVFVEFVDRLQRAAGGLDQLRKVGAHHHDAFPEVQKLVGQFVSPARFFRFFWGPISRSAFPHILVDYVEHPPDKVIVTTTLPPKYRDCPGFFVLTEELTRTGTRLIGMPPCQVETVLRPRSPQDGNRFAHRAGLANFAARLSQRPRVRALCKAAHARTARARPVR
jgi:hypothetical protein